MTPPVKFRRMDHTPDRLHSAAKNIDIQHREAWVRGAMWHHMKMKASLDHMTVESGLEDSGYLKAISQLQGKLIDMVK